MNDPQAIGKWQSVDFVQKIEDFEPGEKHWPGDLFLKEMIIFKNGSTNCTWIWTKGLIIDTEAKMAAKYLIKEINGSKYMFFEWKSGDYTKQGKKKIFYYVLKKKE